MTAEQVRAAYAGRVDEYTSLFGSMAQTHEDDRQFVAGWASERGGRIVDAGCGPGHWTNFLAERGFDVVGVDHVAEFVESASARYPSVDFAVGSLEALRLPAASAAGILAWDSIIHTPPAAFDRILEEFARCLVPGGSVVLGFHAGPRVEAFPHAVAPAWFWPVEEIGERLELAGFVVDATYTRSVPRRTGPGTREHAVVVAELADPLPGGR